MKKLFFCLCVFISSCAFCNIPSPESFMNYNAEERAQVLQEVYDLRYIIIHEIRKIRKCSYEKARELYMDIYYQMCIVDSELIDLDEASLP